MKNRRGGFTLVEIMVVIAIMIIIGVGAVTIANNVVEKAKERKTKAAIVNLITALEEYYREVGSYPSGTIADLYVALYNHPKTRPLIDKLDGEFIDNGSFVDSWHAQSKSEPGFDNFLRYQNRGNNNFPKIISNGKDGLPNTADDIVSSDL